MTERDALVVAFLNREHEVNRLMRRLARVDLWANSTVTLASQIAASETLEDGLQILTDMLVNELEFDAAVAIWDDSVRSYPDRGGTESEIFVAIERGATVSELGVVEEIEPSGPWGQLFRCTIGGACSFSVGYRRETFEFLEHDDTQERLDRLAGILMHPFDALNLRLDLMRERDSLQERVRAATTDLRGALETADVARRAAEQSAKVRSQFLAHMSHEIRTPMTAILGYAELLSDPKTRPSQHENYIGIINGSSKHLLQLLDDILDLARIESGQFKLEPQDGSLRQLLQDVSSLMRVKAVEQDLDLSLQLVGEFPSIAQFDPPRLRQVMLNIISNAIKFTEQGSVEIRASVDRQESLLCVEIEDTGPGIPAHQIDEIFEEFSTSDSAGSGAGLGLAISSRLTRIMGGNIEVRSEVGTGSCFTIRVAFDPSPQAIWSAGLQSPSDLLPDSRPDEQWFIGHVLVAEDTPVIRDVAVKWLENLGFGVVAVGDGQAAYDAFFADDGAFDLVFMDMQMPVVDGYEATRNLRARGVRVPVIALTAHAMAGERDRCLAAGCTDYIAKPFTQRQLADVISRYMLPLDERHSSVAEDDEVLQELLGEFIADLQKMRHELLHEQARGDRDACRRIAHKIAGSASTFGYLELASLAKTLSTAARSEVIDILALVDSVTDEINEVVDNHPS